MRELRNHIAHGYLLIQMTEFDQPPVLTLSKPRDLNSLEEPETRHLKFEELIKAMTELVELIEEFKALTGDWTKETRWTCEGTARRFLT